MGHYTKHYKIKQDREEGRVSSRECDEFRFGLEFDMPLGIHVKCVRNTHLDLRRRKKVEMAVTGK